MTRGSMHISSLRPLLCLELCPDGSPPAIHPVSTWYLSTSFHCIFNETLLSHLARCLPLVFPASFDDGWEAAR